MGVVFIISGLSCYMTALIQGYQNQVRAIDINRMSFKTESSFNIGAGFIILILSIIYFLLW